MGQFVFKLPDIGEGVVEGEIVEWHVKPGDTVTEDQKLVDVMTDKATVTIPSTVNGSVVRTSGKPGDLIAVGSELIVFEVAGAGNMTASHEDPAPKANAKPAEPQKSATKTTAANATAPEAAKLSSATEKQWSSPKPNSQHNATSEKPLASPAVRRKAIENNVQLSQVQGSGPAGRIRHEDLDAFLSGAGMGSGGRSRAARSGVTEVPLIGMRRKIAEKMVQSVRSIPHINIFDEADITELEALRLYLNHNRVGNQPKLTYLPFIIQAVVRALEQYPQCNAHFDEEKNVILRHAGVHMGIATQTDKGLMVPVVRNCESLDVWQTSTEVKRMADAARHGTAKINELSGSTFTITSLGALGGTGTTPIINHPEVAILGVNKAEDKPVVVHGAIAVRKILYLSSSFDHRIVDGYDGAIFLNAIKNMLEHPATIFM